MAAVVFFWKFFLNGLLPIPSDTIVGMYHPWRDVIWDDFTNGVPFKNFLITDPVRQQLPWRRLAINAFTSGQLPGWNPYTHTGQPLLANFQTAAFYPLNLIFLILPFNFGWSLLIFLQPLLAGIFMYLYLRHLKLSFWAGLMGAISFVFSGFFIAWLQWGTILHVALWLPLVLLSIDKIIGGIGEKRQVRAWALVLLLALVFSFLAGHLQTWFYLVIVALAYLLCGLRKAGDEKRRKSLVVFGVVFLLMAVITAVQWLPTLQLIKLSARGVDLDWQSPGWFIPWQHLVQFLAPDFFGNPTTLNYWGEWNYGEFVGYIGVMPLILAALGLMGKAGRKRLVVFLGLMMLLAFGFALPTPWAKLPYQLKIPFLSTSQPTRLIFIVDFCLAVLAALGMESLLKLSKKEFLKPLRPLAVFGLIYAGLWGLILLAPSIWPQAAWLTNLPVARRNLILPTGLLMAFGVLIILGRIKKFGKLLMIAAIIALSVFDLFRFGWKFTPFTKEAWLFPSTATIDFLKNDQDIFRIMSTDRRLMPPNFSMAYGLQTVDGYDPLYLKRYGELIAATERGGPDISPPFGFNRIITPQRYDSPLIDLMNVKYVLALAELDSPNLDLVFQENQTRIYENKTVFPRALLVYNYQLAGDKQQAIEKMFGNFDLTQTVILEKDPGLSLEPGSGQTVIKSYSENQVTIEVETDRMAILVLSDAYYPGWQATVDGQATEIFRANYHFRGIMIPEGKHLITFKI